MRREIGNFDGYKANEQLLTVFLNTSIKEMEGKSFTMSFIILLKYQLPRKKFKGSCALH